LECACSLTVIRANLHNLLATVWPNWFIRSMYMSSVVMRISLW